MEKRNVFKIRCNPYTNEIEYYWEDTDTEEVRKIDEGTSCFAKEKLKRNTLKSVGKDIVEGLKLYDTGNTGMDVYFEGTEEDKEELQKCLQMYNKDHDIQLLNGSEYLYSAKYIKQEIEDIFVEMGQMFKKYPDSEITKTINKFNETVRETIPICIMGLYSAGKSAFINALLGVELLPSASDPTTAKTFKISSGEKYEIRFSFGENLDKNVVLSFDGGVYKTSHSNALKIIAELEAIKKDDTLEKRMYHAISIINNYDMERNKNVPEDEKKTYLVSDLIEITLPIKSPVLPIDKYDFVIYDTPGSNSASNTDHTEVLRKAMEGQTNGLPIYVTTPDSMDSNDNLDLNADLEKIGNALDRNNLIVIVNKADDKDLETLFSKKDKFSELCIYKLNPVGTYFVSSPIGLGCKKVIDGNVIINKKGERVPNLFDKTYKKLYKDKISSFEDDEDEDYYTQLYRCNIVPQRQFDEYSKMVIPENMLGYRNSGIHAVECAIAEFADKYAVYNKCMNAKRYLTLALKQLDRVLAENQAIQDNIYIKLRENMNAQQRAVMEQLEKKCDAMERDFYQAYATELSTRIDYMTKIVSSSIEKELEGCYSKVKSIEIKGQTKKERVKEHISNFLDQGDRLTTAVNEILKRKTREYNYSTRNISEGFWKIKISELKEKLCSIITGSSALSQDQRNMLKDAVMNIDDTITFTLTNSLQKKAIANWLGHLKKKTAVPQFTESYKEEISKSNQRFIDQSRQSFVKLKKSLSNQFTKLISEKNEKMIGLRRELDNCSLRIKELEIQREHITLNRGQIDELFEFRYCKEVEYVEV